MNGNQKRSEETRARRARMLKLQQEGEMSVKELAAMFGCSKYTVNQELLKARKEAQNAQRTD